jgi:hypothetical protein
MDLGKGFKSQRIVGVAWFQRALARASVATGDDESCKEGHKDGANLAQPYILPESHLAIFQISCDPNTKYGSDLDTIT